MATPQKGTEIVTDPETGDVIESTQQDKELAQQLFKNARDEIFSLMFTIKEIFDNKSWLHLGKGYKTFKEACQGELNLADYSASRLKTIADVSEQLSKDIGLIAPAQLLIKNGLSETCEDESSNKMRKFLLLIDEIGMSKSYELAKAIQDEKINGVDFIQGKPVSTPSGDEISLDKISGSTTREQLRTWFKPVSDLDPMPRKKTVKKDPVAEFRSHLDRFIREAENMHGRFFSLQITENTFDYGKEKRRELEDALHQFSLDVQNIDRYDVHKEDTVPKHLKESDFVTTKQAAQLVGKSEKTIIRLIKGKEIPYAYLKRKKENGRVAWRLHPEGLPQEYKNLYFAELNRRAQEDEAAAKLQKKKEREKILAALTPEQRSKALNIEYCIENYGHLKGAEMKLALEQHNEKHPDQKPITVKSFYRHIKDYSKEGIKGIADTRGLHLKGETKVNESDFDYFKAAYLTENKKSHKQCWEETLGKAKAEGRITLIDGKANEIDTKTGEVLGTYPVTATFKRLLDRRIPEATQIEMREGKHRFKQTIHFNHVNITRETITPGQIYVMDHHTFDVLCKPTDKKIVTDLLNKILYHNISDSEKMQTEDSLKRILKSGLSGKKHVRLWLTNCMDYRTNKQLSWYLHEDAPNSDHVMMAFKWACEWHGYPDVLMMDNGKDFLALDFAGNPYRRSDVYDEVKIHNLLSYLPTKPHFVLPRESQAKPIERQYRNIIDKYARQWPTYTGKNPAERPEKTSENLKNGKLPTALEVIEKFDEFVVNVLNRKAQGGKALNGKSPDQVWDELHPGKRMPTQKALDLMTMRNSKPRQIYGNGFKMPLMGGHFYTADWMQGLSSTKEKYYAKWDPYQWERIFVFRARDEKPMGWATLEKMTPAWVETEDDRKALSETLQKKKAAAKRRKVTGREVRKIAAGESLEHLAAYVDHENEVYDAVHDARDNGNKPIKLVQTGLDDLARKMNNSYEKNFKQKQDLDLEKITPKKPDKKTYSNPLDDVDVSDMFNEDSE